MTYGEAYLPGYSRKMRPVPVILSLFLAVPFIEILLFVVVGSRIGIGVTIALVILTAIIGMAMVARQGRATFRKARDDLAAGVVPARHLVDGVMVLLAGGLLLMPGFLTDTIGFALLTPGVHGFVRRWGMRRFCPDVTIIP